ncbi:16S rRNA (guanine(966)-N(2))-methyltransferase RsmD [Mycoplasma sp. CSL7475-4]|uniref:16S rRNA (guanine(966)-N(2))-methyltransferase RsmD n=1 Tax=Mycoplasma sp. CSL7475-4 TaxID=2973942 RepID=UPI00216AD467|nr:16S rRNA (guanine(966)-N(2))-methyltransferase RsmD [Mycoplasma sp. CSL7475-4]MCS4536647.1 16S rRNA (guanine(966)-N(2))-methyltransferase RsmD [Mycoplasma sp. CSL7475-4]
MLRIISGKFRRLQIKQPATDLTRPTKDSVREAIFNSIRFDMENKDVLDLFAGSGAMGLEALSNSANSVVFIDNNFVAIKTINDNLKSLKIENQRVLNTDSLKFLANTDLVFDFIFIDPPYKNYMIVNQALELIKESSLLNNEGQIIIETDNIDNIKIPTLFKNIKTKKYGKSFVIFLKND